MAKGCILSQWVRSMWARLSFIVSQRFTNAKKGNQTYTYATPIAIKKGEELGMFNMGSTIVLFIEDFTPQIESGTKVRYAQNLGILS